MAVSILALSTAVPAYFYHQEGIADKVIDMLSPDEEKSKTIKKLYQNSGIKTRYSVLSDFAQERHERKFFGGQYPSSIPGTSQRNDIYKIEAPKLAYEAAAKALKSWGGDPAAITHVISVSCTG
ncbi:MAG TPA: hypothetical protein VGP47_03105, partial [Parachlamydiaceae bacterium]|nr:hypothetical protein [Parachlamydiaceae bacterium]